MEASKLINDKLAQIIKLAREINEIEKSDPAVAQAIEPTISLLFVTPTANGVEGQNELFGMSFGSPVSLMEMNARAFKESQELKELAIDAVRMSEIIDTPLFDMYKLLQGRVRKDKNEQDDTPCDCPNCRAERGELVREPYESGEAFARRKEAIKNNPNIN